MVACGERAWTLPPVTSLDPSSSLGRACDFTLTKGFTCLHKPTHVPKSLVPASAGSALLQLTCNPHFALTPGTLSAPVAPTTTICSCPQTAHHPCVTRSFSSSQMKGDVKFITPKTSWSASSNVPRVTHRALSDPWPAFSLSLAFLYIISICRSYTRTPGSFGSSNTRSSRERN